MPATRRLLVLALDAASPELLRSWAEDGTLPNIAELFATGLVANTRSVDGLYHGATWPSFFTGHDPSSHGIYWSDRLRLGTYRTQGRTPGDLATLKTLWEILSDAGHRVLVLDVPLASRSPDLNGLQVVEWGVHDGTFGFQTTPRRLKREIVRTVGAYPAPSSCDARRSLDEYRLFVDQLARGAAARAELTCSLLAREPWDFAIQVFSETHCAGHQLWHFHDPTHPAFDNSVNFEAGDLVKEVYVAVDRAVGEILAGLARDTAVVLVALHGMSYACGSSLLLPEILTRLGVMSSGLDGSEGSGDGVGGASTAEQDAVRRRGSGSASRSGQGFGIRAAYHRLPKAIRGPLYDLRQLIAQALGMGSPIDIDPSRTKAFYVGFGVGTTFSGIRLNLRGREPAGTVEAGEAERFCERLTRDLLDVTDPDSGWPLVRNVLRTADLFGGPRLDELPDLLVEWDPDRPRGTTATGTGAASVWKAYSERVGQIEKVNSYCRTGEHRVEGLLVARGPGITPGRLVREVSNLDLAPTFARFFGCVMPSTDGRIIPELLPQ